MSNRTCGDDTPYEIGAVSEDVSDVERPGSVEEVHTECATRGLTTRFDVTRAQLG